MRGVPRICTKSDVLMIIQGKRGIEMTFPVTLFRLQRIARNFRGTSKPSDWETTDEIQCGHPAGRTISCTDTGNLRTHQCVTTQRKSSRCPRAQFNVNICSVVTRY